MKMILALTKKLIESGETFSGGSHNFAVHYAQEGHAHGFDVDTMSQWIEARVWEAAVAADFVDNGITPNQVVDASKSLLEFDGNPYDAPQRWDSGCPIYHACNNNDAKSIIDEILRLNAMKTE